MTIFDVGEDDGEPYIVSQLMPGGSIADRLATADDRRLNVEDALRISVEVASALDHAHENGVVHRDLKPANVWFAEDGARLGDFGLAVATDPRHCRGDGRRHGRLPRSRTGHGPAARGSG